MTNYNIYIILIITFILSFQSVPNSKFSLLTDNPIQTVEQANTITIYHTIYPIGAQINPIKKAQKHLIQKSTGYIPLRTQTGNSCGPTSIAMIADYGQLKYESQSFYDDCTNRDTINDKGVTVDYMYICLYNLKLKYKSDVYVPLEKLKTGDIVSYHVLGYASNDDLHFSVIDQNFNKTLRLANPWGQYDTYIYEEFSKISDEKYLIAK